MLSRRPLRTEDGELKPDCLQTARVAALCDDCGVEVGSEAVRCHLVEENGRMGFFCAQHCPVHGDAKLLA